MSNEIMKQESQLDNVHKSERNIEVVTTEIKTLCEQARALALSYAIEIGRRLDEAKGMLSHGEWSEWLKNEVDFSQSTANNYMKLFEEYGDMQISIFGAELKSQTLGNLSYTKALKLLSIPADEREDFVSDNNVEDMSVRDLDKILKERDEAIKRAEEAEKIEKEKEEALNQLEDALKEIEEYKTRVDNANSEINTLNEKLDKSKLAEKKAKEKVKELKDNPEISDDVMNKITADAEAKAAEEAKAEIEKQVAQAQKKLEDALKEKETAETNLLIAQNKVSELEKKIQLSDPKVTEFKTIFEQVQSDLSKLDNALESIEDDNIKEKLSKAIAAVVGKYIVKEV